MQFLKKNIGLEVISSKKYKNINVSFKFLLPYHDEKALAIYSLCQFIGEYSVCFPTKELMSTKKDMLYGMQVDAYHSINNGNSLVNFNYQFLNPKYTEGVSLNDQIAYIKESLFNIYFDEHLINEVKNNYVAKVIRNLDKPMRYASNRVLQIIGHDNNFRFNDLDKRRLIDKLDYQLIKDTYDYLLEKANLYIYVIGDVDEGEITNLFNDFVFENRNKYDFATKSIVLKDFGKVEESKDMSQSYLNVVYETGFNNRTDDYYKWLVADAFLGLVPNSLLFTEVREKRSLCYSISSNLFKSEGISVVSSAISYKDHNEIIKLIDECIQSIINQSYDINDFNTAKKYLINSILSNNDDAKAYIDFIHSRVILNHEYTLDDVTKLIDAVSPNDASEVMKTYKCRLCYVLRGNQDEID